MNDLPIRPVPREVVKTSFDEFKVITLEQADIMVDHPYQVIVVSTSEAMGVGTIVLSFGTQIDANKYHVEQVKRYVAHRKRVNPEGWRLLSVTEEDV